MLLLRAAADGWWEVSSLIVWVGLLICREVVKICEYALLKVSTASLPCCLWRAWQSKSCLHTVLRIEFYCLSLGLFPLKGGSPSVSKEFFTEPCFIRVFDDTEVISIVGCSWWEGLFQNTGCCQICQCFIWRFSEGRVKVFWSFHTLW